MQERLRHLSRQAVHVIAGLRKSRRAKSWAWTKAKSDRPQRPFRVSIIELRQGPRFTRS